MTEHLARRPPDHRAVRRRRGRRGPRPRLLASAAARPQASAFGADAYPELHLKAAALLHSLARDHPLVDGNKRLAWLATHVFLDINGQAPIATQDDVFDLVMAVAAGTLDDLEKIAAQLAGWSP